MGKPIKHSALVQLIGQHYAIVEFEVKYEHTKGSTCVVKINGKQAAAGVSYNEQKKEITPDRNQAGDIAKKAHELAVHAYAASTEHAADPVPKQLSADTIRSG